MMLNKKQIENLIYDYHWMRKEVDRLERIVYGSSIPMKSWGVAQYGIEATLPRGSRGKSKAELEAMDLREERAYKRLQSYEGKVYAVEKLANYVQDVLKHDHMLVIIDCMMDGMSYRSIAAHLGTNREKVRELKDKMLCHFCQNCHFLHELFKGKSIV